MKKLINGFYYVAETIFVAIVVMGVILENKWSKRKWNGGDR
jgi:hypothetical protein